MMVSDIIYDEGRLNLPPRLSFEEWMGYGATIQSLHASVPWYIGDWLAYGESEYGEKYAQGLTLWDYGYQTLINMAWVARQFAPDQRTALSWTHHRYAASLKHEERGVLLERAKDEEWTSRQLQTEVAKAKLNDTGDEEEVAVWVRYTVEISTNKREIKRTSNNINQFLVMVDELADEKLLDYPPAFTTSYKVLKPGTCGPEGD